jgi:L-lactate utilization protein LutB
VPLDLGVGPASIAQSTEHQSDLLTVKSSKRLARDAARDRHVHPSSTVATVDRATDAVIERVDGVVHALSASVRREGVDVLLGDRTVSAPAPAHELFDAGGAEVLDVTTQTMPADTRI